MASYKLIVKNAKVILKTVTNAVLNITGIKDLLTGSGSVDSNTKIDWTLQHYTNTATNFTSTNPILLVGQLGIETDDLLTAPKYKIGDGVTAWNTLPYNSSGGGGLSGLTTNKVLKATSSTTVGNSNITDNSTSITISSPNNQNLVVVEDNNLYIQYLGTTNAGGLTYLNTYVDLQHDVRVNLNAPSVTKNGVEVATVNDLATFKTDNFLDATSSIQTQLNSKGYTQSFVFLAFSPVDATTYYIGFAPNSAPTTSVNTTLPRSIMITKTGTIKSIALSAAAFNVTGSSEDSVLSVELYDINKNFVSSTTISSVIKFNVIFHNQYLVTGLNISVLEGYNVILKWVTPTWTTNPTQAWIQGNIYIQP